MATHSSILTCKFPCTEEPCGLQSTGRRVRRDRARTHMQPLDVSSAVSLPLGAQPGPLFTREHRGHSELTPGGCALPGG